MSEPLALYLHIPFCRHRCAYCDFNTYTSLGDLKDSYARALSREIEQVGAAARDAGKRRSAASIYFGGGTPSLMPVQAIGSLIGSARLAFGVLDDAEISLEANPDTVDVAYLEAIRAAGVTRLSFGAQSAVESELTLLEREHTFQAVVEAVAMARKAGLDNFNLDLIYGLPGQSLASWQFSLEAALELAPPHLSLYCLTIEPGTPMQQWLQSGLIEAPDPDLAADQYELATTRLQAAGYDHYEISNWSLPGHACRHNLIYWRNQEYLGLGAGAHGHAAGVRYANVRQPRVYIRRMNQGGPVRFPHSAAVAQQQQLSPAMAMADTVITRLRLLHEGLDLEDFSCRFGKRVDDVYGETLRKLEAWDLLERDNGRLRLTPRGRFLSNQVFYRFM